MTLWEPRGDFLVDLNDPAKRRVSIAILFETPGGRLKLYRTLIGCGHFVSLRDVVHWVEEQEYGESARKQFQDEWRKRQQQKFRRGMLESRRIPDYLRSEVLYSGSCAYCSNPYPTQVDHIVPVSQGGNRRRRNLAPVCWPCNYEKRGLTVEEWRRRRIETGKCWPPLPRDGAASGAVEYGNPEDVPMPYNYRPPPKDMRSPELRRLLDRERGCRYSRPA